MGKAPIPQVSGPLGSWISLDGHSGDGCTELLRVIREMPDDEQWDECFVSRLRRLAPIFSGTLRSADWPGSQIASGDTAQEIARLKAARS